MLETGIIVLMVFLAVFGGYVLASLLLFKCPTLVHKKKKLKFTPKHISHRGGAGENLENTLTAFQHACELGTEMLELDCQITKDGKVVVSHDNTLKRICGIPSTISETNYHDLPRMQSTLKLDFHSAHLCNGGEDRKIPTLKEVFEAFPDTPINIDIKVDDDELIQKVNQLIIEHNREHLCIWGSRLNTVCNKLHKLNPEVPLFFSLRRILTLVVLYYTGLLSFVPIKESSFEVVMPSIVLDESKSPLTLNWKRKAFVRFVESLLMRPSLFNHLKKRGIHVYLWVLNEETEFERAFKLGATGVMTDFPTKLTDFLKQHPEYQENRI